MNAIRPTRPLPIAIATALSLTATLALAAAFPVRAAGTTYKVDPDHTFPSFEADHLGGLSLWRGKFNRSSGSIVLDRAAGTGSVDVRVDVASVDFGHQQLNEMAQGETLFETAKYPEAVYRGRLAGFEEGRPSRVEGEFTLRGVTRPLTLEIRSFKCMPHPVYKREVCGADAAGTFQRDAYGMDAGKDYGFDMAVRLRIQVEAIAEPVAAAAANDAASEAGAAR